MLITSRFTGIAASILWLLAWSAPCFGQHHNDRPRGTVHHRSIQWVDPGGHAVQQHHETYRSVLPATTHHGSYYSYNNAHYYTPPTPPVIVSQPVVVQKPVVVEFGSFRHYEELATRLAGMANELCLDLHHNHRRNPKFGEIYREAYKVLQDAKYVHGSEHRGDRKAIQAVIGPLDDLFHHVRGEISGWKSEEVRRVGTASPLARLEEMEALIHHLMFDAGVKHQETATTETAPPPAEIAPPPTDPLPPPAPRR